MGNQPKYLKTSKNGEIDNIGNIGGGEGKETEKETAFCGQFRSRLQNYTISKKSAVLGDAFWQSRATANNRNINLCFF